MICGYFRKDVPCELLGIFTLVYVNKNVSDERSFHFCGSGSYVDDCVYCYKNEYLGKWFMNNLGKIFHVNFLGYSH